MASKKHKHDMEEAVIIDEVTSFPTEDEIKRIEAAVNEAVKRLKESTTG